MARPESEFPTIEHVAKIIDDLVKRGFGQLPVQLLMVPDSTLVALATDAGGEAMAAVAKMIEFDVEGQDMGLLVASVEGLNACLGRRHGVQ